MEELVHSIENSLITYKTQILKDIKSCEKISKNHQEFICFALKRNFEKILKTSIAKELFSFNIDEIDAEKYEKILEKNIDTYLSSEVEDVFLRHLAILLVGVSSLYVFMLHNFTGPPLDNVYLIRNNKGDSSINGDDRKLLIKLDEELRTQMDVNGESVDVNTQHMHLLCIAKACLVYAQNSLQNFFKTSAWWSVRCLWVLQSLYDERLPSLSKQILQYLCQLEKSALLKTEDPKNTPSNTQLTTSTTNGPLPNNQTIQKLTTESTQNFTTSTNKTLKLLFYIEATFIYNFYYQYHPCNSALRKATLLSNLNLQLTGVMGKRTRFQQAEVPQLILKIGKMDGEGNEEMKEYKKNGFFIQNVPLEDEAVLERAELSEQHKNPFLSCSLQLLVFAVCRHMRRMREGQGSVVKEEAMAYINALLDQQNSSEASWALQTSLLLLRCKHEDEGSKYLHRKLMQLEELVKSYQRYSTNEIKHNEKEDKDDDDEGSDDDRLKWIFSCGVPPQWSIKNELGSAQLQLGLQKGALDTFLRIKNFSLAVKCHTALGEYQKAESIIKEQMAIKETPLLWCSLGDVTGDVSCYEKAWELSNHRSARAKRGVALLLMSKQKFEESLSHFEASLEINPLQLGLWFTYGCACLPAGSFQKAAKAFRTCVNLDNDNFQAWNNLATTYIKTDDKPRAFMTLQEAIKCDYENWRIWANLLCVAVDIGEFEEAIRSYHRLIDLRHKHIDVEVLEVLTRAVVEGLKMFNGCDAYVIKEPLKKLFGRITSTVSNNADIWRLYAKLTNHIDEGQTLSQSEQQKALQYLQKSQRILTLQPNWHKQVDGCLQVCRHTFELAQGYLDCAFKMEEADTKLSLLNSARLALQSVIITANKGLEELGGDEDLSREIEKLEGFMQDVKKASNSINQ